MACGLLGSVTVAATLVPMREFQEQGAAVHRALSYLAHGGRLSNGLPGSALNSIFGPEFGTVYDACTIAILCLAGACVAIALRDYVPEYLKRFGMELEWAHRIGIKMRFFNVLVLIVQSFMKIRVLHAMAPTGEEAVVKITQVCALVLCIVLGVVAGKNFKTAAH